MQGAIFSYDHAAGYVVAMVGGADYDRSEFNRVVQACRQPGSTYKPIYYSLALDKGYGFTSLLNDIPRAEVDPITGEVWTPTNLNNTVEYQVTLEYALVWSKNIPSVQLFKLVGGKEVEKLGAPAGLHHPDHPRPGAGAGRVVHALDELTRAFSAFARNGVAGRPGLRAPGARPRAATSSRTTPPPAIRWAPPDLRLDRLVALAERARRAGHPAAHRVADLDSCCAGW